MNVSDSMWINAPAEAVWELVEDPAYYLHFMEGITRWEVVSTQSTGLGARYQVLMHVGSAEIGGLVECVEYVPNRELAWTSVLGIQQRGRWRLRPDPLDEDRCEIELRLWFHLPGGIVGWVAGAVARLAVQRHVQRSLRELRRQVEHEQARITGAVQRGSSRNHHRRSVRSP